MSKCYKYRVKIIYAVRYHSFHAIETETARGTLNGLANCAGAFWLPAAKMEQLCKRFFVLYGHQNQYQKKFTDACRISQCLIVYRWGFFGEQDLSWRQLVLEKRLFFFKLRAQIPEIDRNKFHYGSTINAEVIAFYN